MSGFAATHREIFNHPLFNGSVERAGAWIYLFTRACWTDRKFDVGGKIIELKRGQLCVSRSQLSRDWGWSGSKVERFLTRLKTEQMIEQDTGQGRSVITICNYDKYQAITGETGQPTGQAIGQPSDKDRTTKEPLNHYTKGSIGEVGESIYPHHQDENLEPTSSAEDGFFAGQDLGERPIEYAFDGQVIKLNMADLKKWEAAFTLIPLQSELLGIDGWLAQQGEKERRDWFYRTQSLLTRKNREAHIAMQQQSHEPEMTGGIDDIPTC